MSRLDDDPAAVADDVLCLVGESNLGYLEGAIIYLSALRRLEMWEAMEEFVQELDLRAANLEVSAQWDSRLLDELGRLKKSVSSK